MSRSAFPAASSIHAAPRITASRPATRAATGAAIIPGLMEVPLVWALSFAMVVTIFTTYARVDPSELYHVGHSGLAGGASRVLIVLNFPIAMIALALLAITVSRLLAHPWSARPGRRRMVIGGAFTALALCAITVWPGVVT